MDAPAHPILQIASPTEGALHPDDVIRAWRDARDDEAAAYRAWCSAEPDGLSDAHAVYRAAADRESAAAALCERIAGDVAPNRPRR